MTRWVSYRGRSICIETTRFITHAAWNPTATPRERIRAYREDRDHYARWADECANCDQHETEHVNDCCLLALTRFRSYAELTP